MSETLVTLGLLNGQAKTGRLGPFSPSAPDVVFELEAAAGRRPREIVAAEQIAYIAQHRTPDTVKRAVVTIPVSLDRDGLPIGIQIVGPLWSDARLLAIAKSISRFTGKRRTASA